MEKKELLDAIKTLEKQKKELMDKINSINDAIATLSYSFELNEKKSSLLKEDSQKTIAYSDGYNRNDPWSTKAFNILKIKGRFLHINEFVEFAKDKEIGIEK